MEYVEKLAEEAVKEAIGSLVANGKRAYSGSVPAEAARLLTEKGRGRVSQAIAAAKVALAVERLKDRREIKAPPARQHDWVVVGHQSQPPSSGESS
jgi:hypothetical protein